MDIVVAIAFGLGVVLWALMTERRQYKRFNTELNQQIKYTMREKSDENRTQSRE